MDKSIAVVQYKYISKNFRISEGPIKLQEASYYYFNSYTLEVNITDITNNKTYMQI